MWVSLNLWKGRGKRKKNAHAFLFPMRHENKLKKIKIKRCIIPARRRREKQMQKQSQKYKKNHPKQSPLSHRRHIILSATLDLFLKRSVSLWLFWSLKSFVLSWSDRLGFIIDDQILLCNLREWFLKNVHRGLLLLRDRSKMTAMQKSPSFFCHLKFQNCIIKNLPEKKIYFVLQQCCNNCVLQFKEAVYTFQGQRWVN